MIYSLLDCKKAFIESLNHSHETEDPYPLWQIDNVFPTEAVNDLLDIKTKLTTMEYSLGRREENNDKRGFFDVDRRRNVPACDTISNLFQDSDTVHAIEEKFGIDLAGTYLRIEFSQDSDGFWLEPHTDIGAKNSRWSWAFPKMMKRLAGELPFTVIKIHSFIMRHMKAIAPLFLYRQIIPGTALMHVR